MTKGTQLILEERQRQIEQEDYTSDHDSEHKNYELTKAAIAYLRANIYGNGHAKISWPTAWDIAYFKPRDKIKNLTKAGALIAAELDRLLSEINENI